MSFRIKARERVREFRIDENIATNKTEAFYKRTASGKRLLREAMRGLIPNNIIEGKKQGFRHLMQAGLRRGKLEKLLE